MAKSNDTRIDTVAGRKSLPVRREPYWYRLGAGKTLGARKTTTGICTWLAKFYDPETRKKTIKNLGDDQTKLADYENKPMDFDRASKAAQAWFTEIQQQRNEGVETTTGYTLQDAIDDYVKHVRANKGDKAADLVPGRLTHHLSDRLKNTRVSELTTRAIKNWLNGQVRSSEEFDADKVRASKDTANRRLAVLKACLNLAFGDGIVNSDTAWRRVKRFENTSAARSLFLSESQVAALLAKTKGGVHDAIKAGVLTGARRGELFALRVRDFDAKEGTLRIAGGKTGTRDVYLSDAAVAFFKQLAKSKLPEVHLLTKDDGTPWPEDDLTRPFKAAVRAAKAPPETTYYSLRHYHISRALLAGVQPQVVAENCGTSLRMIEKHYGKFLKTDRRAMFNGVAL